MLSAYFRAKILLIFLIPILLIAEEQPGLMWKRSTAGSARRIVFSPDSKYIAVDDDSYGGRIHIITTETNIVVKVFDNKVILPYFSTDNMFFYYVKNNLLIKTKVESWEQIDSIDLGLNLPETKYFNLDFTHDGKHAILSKGFLDNYNRDPLGIDIYDLDSMKIKQHIETNHPINFASMSADKKFLACAWDKVIKNDPKGPGPNRRTWGTKSFIFDIINNKILLLNDTSYCDFNYGMYNFFNPINQHFLTYGGGSFCYLSDFNNIYIYNNFYNFSNRFDGYTIYSPWSRDGNYFSIWNNDPISKKSTIDIYSVKNWEKVIEFPNFYKVNGFAVNEQQNRLILYSPGGGGGNFLMVNLTGTSVPTEGNFQLSINPNPILNQANISFNLELPSMINLTLNDLTGNQIQIINNDFYQSGENQIPFNTQGLTTGVYFIKLEVNDKFQTKQFVIN